ncbi:MAG: hypothetical protein OSJ43_06615 [Oscillospiraceae bacterium]|nr:hypothetical protein [Oscillospiraceae bacterium]
MTTKEQERKALEKIQKIVADLGENSYIGTALDGALNLAEENIDCDAAFSARYYIEELHRSEGKLNEAEEKISALEKEMAAQKEQFKQAYEMANRRILSAEDMDAVKTLVITCIAGFKTDANDAAERIVAEAENPKSVNFQNAVTEHRCAMEGVKRYEELSKRLTAISDNMNGVTE